MKMLVRGYSSEVCPFCDKWNCCDIKYENIKDIKIAKVPQGSFAQK